MMPSHIANHEQIDSGHGCLPYPHRIAPPPPPLPCESNTRIPNFDENSSCCCSDKVRVGGGGGWDALQTGRAVMAHRGCLSQVPSDTPRDTHSTKATKSSTPWAEEVCQNS